MIDARKLFAQKHETELITAAKNGDRQAFAKLYQLHLGRVYGLCLRMLSNREQAEDVTQEAFVQAWQKLDSFRGEAKFSTWLYALTTNTVLSHMRKQKSWLQRVFSLDSEHLVEPETAEIEDLSDLDKAILRLPEKARLVFVLFAVEGYRHEEIAQMLNIAVGSSKSHYHRARKLLQGWVSP
ncbi:sigma-70 family RNA polymerase sigma factor [Thalassotalea ponticola]|nr:sigma-70 family RNA polymerase sigma factor [Thalassotalea ponticola]MDN3653759.1 sigma-70 family RNA polymerase sigma factor [Thalassotalea ponticola]